MQSKNFFHFAIYGPKRMRFSEYLEPSTDRSRILSDTTSAVQYCLDTCLLPVSQACPSCNSTMTLSKGSRYANGMFYWCKTCHCWRHLLANLRIATPKLSLDRYFLCIYKFLELSFEKDVLRNVDISKSTYQKVKGHLNDFFKFDYEQNMQHKLGGAGISLQVDETVIGHNSIPTCPSNLNDNFPGIVWLLGIIECDTGRIKLLILPDRTANTFISIFKEHIADGSIIYTDGHRSYPQAVEAIDSVHGVVNHSAGFKTIEGFHTNNIENLWSILKYEVRRRRGVVMANVGTFICEFTFRYANLRERTHDTMISSFRKIVEYLFNKFT